MIKVKHPNEVAKGGRRGKKKIGRKKHSHLGARGVGQQIRWGQRAI